ncbi:hypothetical protein ES705_10822 [subsurface metagenome]
MKRGGPPDFGLDYFSPIGLNFQDRKSRIKTICFKVCSKCGETKPIFKFSVDKRNINGRTGICKICRSREYLEYYYQNKERILIKCKEYRDNDKGRRSIYSKKYQKDHKKQLKKKAGEWYKKNKKAIKKRNLQYYQDNKEAFQVRKSIWITKNKEKIREYNREYKRKQRIKNKN